ncbi:hypothetical protein KY290_028047 [Solanum tuberosum]|uniref:Rhodanese domain-containing protein n=1 Tax=Solanum tuberosum TaxID=4113 RepID=A0ABQ7UGS4_SOLTU|nr:hypothetical protein KY290_028047 [Solanum tuberosum]
MAALTSVSAGSTSASLQHRFHSVSYSTPIELASVTCSLATSVKRRSFSLSNNSSTLRIRCAATKPAKSPAEEDWSTKRAYLLEKRVRSVEAKEAFRLQKENNFVILDVRPEAEFKEAHPEGAINVQIYRLIKEWTAWDITRRVAFAFFGIFSGTEENPEFLQLVESKINKDAKIIVACSSGGTMKPTQNLPEGQQSRTPDNECSCGSSTHGLNNRTPDNECSYLGVRDDDENDPTSDQDENLKLLIKLGQSSPHFELAFEM